MGTFSVDGKAMSRLAASRLSSCGRVIAFNCSRKREYLAVRATGLVLTACCPCYIHKNTPMPGEARSTARWFDLVWLLFLGCLALLPPIGEWHKQVILAFIAIFQLLETRFIRLVPAQRGQIYAILIKIGLASLLINHTGEISGINSSYYPIYYLPIMTAAMYFGPWGTLLWTALASGAYLSNLIPAVLEYELDKQ